MPKEDASVDYYAILGVPSSATADEVRKQFKKLALLYHPDRNVGKEAEFNTKFQSIQAAHELLTDPTRRRVYDRSRAVYRATSSTTSGYPSTNYRSSPTTAPQPRTSQSNGGQSAYHYAKAAKEQAARAAAAQARAESDARRQHAASSAWAHRKQQENWGYPHTRNRREEVPRTPKKTRDNPYATDEYATRGSHTDEPRKESSGFFANRNPREKEWMQADGAYGGGPGSMGARKFGPEAKAAEQPHSAPRPASTAYSFTPKQRVRMNLYEGAPKPQRSNDDFSASSRGSPRMRSHAARESPPQATTQSNIHNRRKSSTSGIGSELNNSEGSRFTYLFNKDGPRGPARSARHFRPAEVEDDDDDDDDDFFVKLKNRRNAPPAGTPFTAKRQTSLGEEQIRGRTAEPLRTSNIRPSVYRDEEVSPSTMSSSDSERESSVSPTPPSKPHVDPAGTRPKARMRIPKPRVDDADDVSSDSDVDFSSPRRARGPSPNMGYGFRFKFDTSSSQENMTNGANTNPPTPPTSAGPPIFDFTAIPNQPPDSNGVHSGTQPTPTQFDPQAWKDSHFTFANGFEPAQSPRKMPANNRMHTSFDTQGPVNFSRPRPASMAQPSDAGDVEVPRFSSPEPEADSKRSGSEDHGEARPPPPAPQEQSQHSQQQAQSQAQYVPQSAPAFVFQASQWEQEFSNMNPFELRSNVAPGVNSSNGPRPSKNRKIGGMKKIPVSAFPVPSNLPPQPSPSTTKPDNEKPGTFFSAFAFPKTPSMQNSKATGGTGASTPSDIGPGGGGLSGVSGAPSPMAMDLDTPNTSPPPKEKQDGLSESSTSVPEGASSSTTQSASEPSHQHVPGNNPFEPDRSSRRTRSRSPKKMHKPTSSASIKSNPATHTARASSPPMQVHPTGPSANTTLPRQKTSSPKKARTRLSMDDLGAVPPFAVPPSTGGINGQWTEFADNLPFASQSAPHVNLSPPASPKKEVPTVPPTPIAPTGFTDLTDSGYRKYSNQMQTYQTYWNHWNEAINGHFRARVDHEVMACAKNQGLTGGAFIGGSDGIASDLSRIQQALKDFEIDQELQKNWVASCKGHAACLTEWKVYLEALENRVS